jgi:hypothetical protein
MLANRFRTPALIAVALAGALAWATLAWATWPTGNQLNTESCLPIGLFAKLSAAVHGRTFWRAQLTDVARRLQSAEDWDQDQADWQARLDDVVRQSEANLNAIYEAHPSLAPPTDAQLAAKRLRTLADKVEHDEARRTASELMRKELPVLKRCEEIIIERLQ